MPGYNHYPSCICGWCYKAKSNGYSGGKALADFNRSFAERHLKATGASRSWTACFVDPNVWCPVCGAKVFFYQNQHGSRVYFDDLGWPWPKHPCTDNTTRAGVAPKPIIRRTRGAITEILDAANICAFEPNAKLRSRFGHSPWDLLIVAKIVRLGFENIIEAESISPLLDEPIFIRFSAAPSFRLLEITSASMETKSHS